MSSAVSVFLSMLLAAPFLGLSVLIAQWMYEHEQERASEQAFRIAVGVVVLHTLVFVWAGPLVTLGLEIAVLICYSLRVTGPESATDG
jgi:uncharacterized membrane protein YsdA (DUF1294 family)